MPLYSGQSPVTLDTAGLVPAANLGTGSANASAFLRRDRVWALPGTSAAATGVDHFTVTLAATATAGIALNVVVTAKDSAGATLTGYTGAITVSSSDAAATDYPFSYTFALGDAGTKTFSKAFRTAGSQTVRVQEPATGLLSTSAASTVTVTTTWDPMAVGTGGAFWIRGELQAEADGATITTVVNQKSGGTNFTAPGGAAGKKPIKANGVGGSNARGAIRFDGSNDTVVGQVFDIHAGFTIAVAGRVRTMVPLGSYPTGTYKLATIWDDGDTAQQQLQLTVLGDGTVQCFVYHYNSGYIWIGRSTAPAAVRLSEDVLLEFTYDGGTTPAAIKIYVGGVRADVYDANQGVFTALGAAPTRGLQFGGQGDTPDQALAFDLYDATGWTTVLSAGNLTTVTTEVSNYIGLRTGTTPPPPPPAGSGGATLTREELIGTISGADNGASGWNVAHTALLRTRTALDLYFQGLIDNNDPLPAGDQADYRRKVRLWKRTGDNAWTDQNIAFDGGYDNAHLLQDGAGTVRVIAWPGAVNQAPSVGQNRPRVWDSASGTTRDLFIGGWHGNRGYGNADGRPYAGMGVDPANNRYTMQRINITSDNSAPNIPGYFEAARSTDNGATYAGPVEWQHTERYAYWFLVPNGAGWDGYATRDLSFQDLGITNPVSFGGNVAYAFDAVQRFHWAGEITAAPASITTLRSEPATQAQPNNRAQCVDVFVDAGGRTHVLVNAYGPGTGYAWQLWHYVLNTSGTVLASNVVPLQYGNFARMFQLSTSSRIGVISANGFANQHIYLQYCLATDADVAGSGYGAEMGSQSVPQPSATTMGSTNTQNVFCATARAGGDDVKRDYVDLVVVNNHQPYYFRVQF